MSLQRGFRHSHHRSRGNDQFWVHADPPPTLHETASFGRRSNNGFVPSAIPSENVRMERRQSSRARHAEVYAYHRRLDNCLMASVTILSLLTTLTVIGLVVWAMITSRESAEPQQDVYRTRAYEQGLSHHESSMPGGE
jgi:hypothetical protein